MTTYLLKALVDSRRLARFTRSRGARDVADLGHGAHQLLRQVWAEHAPRPFRLRGTPRGVEIWGYSGNDADAMNEMCARSGDPELVAIFQEPRAPWVGRPVPAIPAGERVGFVLKAAPVCRPSQHGNQEQDALISYRVKDEDASRDEAYRWWLTKRLGDAAALETFRLLGFQNVLAWRRGAGKGPNRRGRAITIPDALMGGDLLVHDEETFARLLASGVGRHKAFGFGMLLLQPPSPPRC